MSGAATTKMSSKGQVVIPEEVRNRLGLKAGAQFVVLGEGDVVILKAIQPLGMEEFDEIVSRARQAASRSGLKETDVEKAIKDARARK